MTHATAGQAAPAPLLVQRTGGLVTLQFNRPQALNALDLPMAQDFLAAMRGIAADDGVRAVLLKGAGRAFMAGGDLASMRDDVEQAARELISTMNQALALLHALDAPVIAQVHGAVAGGGLSLALMCDFVLAAEGTKFNMAYINLGTNCDLGGSWALPRLVGLRRALEISMLGDSYDADQALQMGLINRVVPAQELDATCAALAQRLANGPTRAYGRMRRLMRGSFDRSLPEQLQAELDGFAASARTADMQEGIAAFFGKRKAEFRGR